jgi:ribonucleotide reductase alpha subunit
MFLDDTACNLASLNLMTFIDADGGFDVESFRQSVSITILAQEIMVDDAAYPTANIGRNSHLFRPLGLGYANLGALLMTFGLPYDSDEGRNLAATITSLMCGQAYRTSAEIAEAMGPFPRYRMNRRPFLEVIGMHRAAADAIPADGVPEDLLGAARDSWVSALEAGRKWGYKNAQVTVLAPTGTSRWSSTRSSWAADSSRSSTTASRWRCAGSATRRSRWNRSWPTSTSTRRSRAPRTWTSRICRSSTVHSGPRTAPAPSTGWGTCA